MEQLHDYTVRQKIQQINESNGSCYIHVKTNVSLKVMGSENPFSYKVFFALPLVNHCIVIHSSVCNHLQKNIVLEQS